MSEALIDKLENGYRTATGESARVEFISWHAHDGSDAVAYFDSHKLLKIGRNA